MGDIYLWRQVFILITNMLFSMNIGYTITFPSVLMPDLLSANNTEIQATPNQVSWIATSNGIGGIFGFLLLPPILQKFGRKLVHIINCLFLLIGWIILVLAHNVTALIAARVIQGLALGGLYVHAIILSEYCAPTRRGYFVTIKKSSTAIGALVCHSLFLLRNWRQIAMFAIIFPTLSILLTLFWPESPSFLAMKGRYKDCEKSFIWLHGDSKLNELHLLQYSQQQRLQNLNVEKWYKFIFKKDFVNPFLISCFLTMIVESCGKHYLAVYITQMMMELVRDESLAIYFTIGADTFVVAATIFSIFIISYFDRRTVLLTFGVLIVPLMFIISIVAILKFPTVTWLAPSLIIFHNFAVNISFIPVCFTLFGELIPLEYKGWGSCLSGIVMSFLYTLILKITPLIMESAGVGGVYAIFGITITVCLLVLYFIMPETKDRTLAEIENEFKGTELTMCEENKRLQMID